MKYDYLIVGSGLFGATFCRLALDAGKKCIVLDKRNHIGGNLFCENIEGINVHKYGAHIFHTSDEEIWNFVNSYAKFNRFTNSPMAIAPDGRIYNLPFNMNTFAELWGIKTPQEALLILEQQRTEAIELLRERGHETPTNLEEQALVLVGKDIFEKLIKGYTEKQWGRKCKELPTFIIQRIPVRLTYDNNYFNDKYQGIPIGGYNPFINALLRGANINLNTDFFDRKEYWLNIANRTIYTGPIDRFYEYRFGRLQYRTVRLEEAIIDCPNYQGNAVVNYTSSDIDFTRIIEHKHFEKFGNEVYDNPHTVISKEYPLEWEEGQEPFYPINDVRNQEIYNNYKMLADKENEVYFGGRLAEYKYYDMAPVIRKATELFFKLENPC